MLDVQRLNGYLARVPPARAFPVAHPVLETRRELVSNPAPMRYPSRALRSDSATGYSPSNSSVPEPGRESQV